MIKGIIFLFFYCLLLTLCIFIPYSLHLVNGVSNVIDPLFYAWNLSYNADNMFSGLSSALNTNIFYPLNNTLAYSDTLWVQSLLTNPIIWLTNNPILAENLAVMFTFPLSAVSMYLLAWHFTKNTRASFLSGIFFTFSYPRLSQIGHLPIISSQWLPLYLLFLIKFLNDGKRINFLFLCIFYLFAIGSSIYFGVFLIPITLLILLIDMLNRIRHHTINEYSKLTISAFPIVIPFSILLTLIVFPYVRLKVEYPTIKRAIDDVTFLRASPVDFISILPTSLFSRFLPNNTNEHALFPTFTLILLAFFGIIRSAKRYRYAVVVFITIAASSFILSLGNEQSFSIGSFSIGPLKLPYYYFYMWFPIFQIVRVPARFSIFIILSLSMLASFRLDALLKKPR